MNDKHLPGAQIQPPQPATPASQDLPHATLDLTKPLNDATANEDVSDASDAEESISAAQEPPPAAQITDTSLNEKTVATATSGASDAIAGTPAAVVDALRYNLTVPQAQKLFADHNRRVPAERTIQNYCAEGLIAGEKVSTSSGAEWLINDHSLLGFIQSKPELTTTVEATPTSPPAPAAAHASPDPLSVPEDVEDEEFAAVGEQRTIAQMLIENAKLLGQLETKDAVIAGKNDELTRIEQTNQELRSDREFLREEITDKRRLNQDLKDITSQVLELLEMGFVNRGAQIPAEPEQRPIPAAPEQRDEPTPSWRSSDTNEGRPQDERSAPH